MRRGDPPLSPARGAVWFGRLAFIALLVNARDPFEVAAAALLLALQIPLHEQLAAWDQRRGAATPSHL